MLAGVLYLGSGLGLLAWLALRKLVNAHRQVRSLRAICRGLPPRLPAAASPDRLCSCTDSCAPTRYRIATAQSRSGADACIAWIVFRENVDRRVFLGMTAIVAGGVLLSWDEAPRAGSIAGPLLIAGACLAWALDNN